MRQRRALVLLSLRVATVAVLLWSGLPARMAEAQVATCFTTPTSSLPSRFGVGTFPVRVAVGDFNRDGVPDLAVANPASDNVSIRLGVGDGTFTPASPPEVGVGRLP